MHAKAWKKEKKRMRAKARQNEKHASSSMAKRNKSSISPPLPHKDTRDENQEKETTSATTHTPVINRRSDRVHSLVQSLA